IYGRLSHRAVRRLDFLVVGSGDGRGHRHGTPNGRQRVGLTNRAGMVYRVFHALSRSDKECRPSGTWAVRWMGRLLASHRGDKLAAVAPLISGPGPIPVSRLTVFDVGASEVVDGR